MLARRLLCLPVIGLAAIIGMAIFGDPPLTTRSCTATTPPADADPEGTIVLGRVLFVTPVGARPGDELQHSPAADGRQFSKFGIFVFGDARVTIEPVGPVDILGWAQTGATSRVTDRVDFEHQPPRPCSDQAWSVYPGGLVYTQPQCATVRVRADGQTREVRFGLGVGCHSERAGSSSR